nr:aa3-type cytochrome c oxidase subunit IV [Chthonobacter rhizosphaerae]
MDYNEHEKTYGLFITLTKYGTAIVVVILILMALFLL